MKALTIKQPWASLIMLGYKEYEFRSWKTKYRGPLMIHAGLGVDKEAYIRLKKYLPEKLPLGQILGTVNVTDCIICNEDFKKKCQSKQKDIYAKTTFDEHYAWKIENVKVFEKPIAVKGKLGLWNYEMN